MNTQSTEEILEQMKEELKAHYRSNPVAAYAFEATFTGRARSGQLEELIERVLTDWLHEEIQNYDHRLTGERLADFHEFAARKIKDMVLLLCSGIEAMAKSVQPEVAKQVELLTLREQANA